MTKKVSSKASKPVSNPFESDSDSERKPKSKNSKTSSVQITNKSKFSQGPAGLENKSNQELEEIAVNKAEETTKAVNGCLKIAEDIREDASNTLVMLHEQGEQITRTHQTAANMEKDLSMGEKLLGSLGGIFSKPWKPKKGHKIKGPSVTKDDSFKRKGGHQEQREKLGITQKGKSNAKKQNSEPTSAMEKVEAEKAKQVDGLNDLSNVLDQLKDMAVDMGTEIDKQNIALDQFNNDVDELNNRVKGANQRANHLLAK